MLLTTDLAYLAAMIDGEGCINISKRMAARGVNPSYRLELIISNNCRAMLDHLRALHGGVVHETRPGHFQLRFGARDTRTALMRCLPYFLIKRRQAEIALAFYATFSRPMSAELILQREAFKQELHQRPLG